LRYNILVNLLVLIFIMSSQKKKGFTLLELLLVIAIIAIIAAIVIVAINPARQLAQARNAQRASDLNAIYKAVQQYYIDTGNWPPPDDEIPEVLTDICWTGGGESTGCVSLDDNDDGPILVPTYLSALPQNPSGENYKIALNVGAKKIAMTAPGSREAGLLGVVLGTSTDMVLEEDDDNGGGGGGDDDPEPECSDGIDNDDDGTIDYGDGDGDEGCSSDDDDSENSESTLEFYAPSFSFEFGDTNNSERSVALTDAPGDESRRVYRFNLETQNAEVLLRRVIFTAEITDGTTANLDEMIIEAWSDIDGGDFDNSDPINGSSTAEISKGFYYTINANETSVIDLVATFNAYQDIPNFESGVSGFQITGVTVEYSIPGTAFGTITATSLVDQESGAITFSTLE
jgi:prepilin-type N-terminal cleavage/methylation domain-containing protein